MRDNPLVMGLAAVLAIVVLFQAWAFFSHRTTGPEMAPNVKLNENRVKYEDEGIVKVVVPKSSWISDRLSYQERRQIREATFRNYMTVIEQAEDETRKINENTRQLKRSLDGIAGRHYQSGIDLIGQQKYEEAISQFILAVKAEPNNMIIRLLTFKRLAMVYKALNYERRYCVAMVKYLELLEKYEDNATVQEQIRNTRAEIEEKLRTL